MIAATREIVVELERFVHDAANLAERAKSQLFPGSQPAPEQPSDDDRPAAE